MKEYRFYGCVFDLTSEQFGDEVLDYSNCPELSGTVQNSPERYTLPKRKKDCVMNICGHSFWKIPQFTFEP